MRTSNRRISTLFLLPAVLLLFVGQAVFLTGCATSRSAKTETTGQYVDDSAITGKIKAAILKDPDLKVSQISVETYKGVVQLSGFVDTPDMKSKATEVANSVPGVVKVKNDLIIKAG